MADAISVSAPVSGTDKTLTFETGKFALQSQGAVIAKIGETTVLATANAAKGVRDGIDFFPLTWTLKSVLTQQEKFQARSSVVKAVQARQQFLLADSPTDHCAQPSQTATATRHKWSSRLSVQTKPTRTMCWQSTQHPHHS